MLLTHATSVLFQCYHVHRATVCATVWITRVCGLHACVDYTRLSSCGTKRIRLYVATLVYQTHMTVEDDGPYESEDDGWPSLCDIRDVYVHQFDLVKRNRNKLNKLHIPCFCLLEFLCFFLQTYRLFLEKVQRCLNVGPLLKHAAALLPLLWRHVTTTAL